MDYIIRVGYFMLREDSSSVGFKKLKVNPSFPPVDSTKAKVFRVRLEENLLALGQRPV